MISSTQDTNPAAALYASLDPKTQKSKSGVVDTQDKFLKLLVTQLQNQDPLNPMDNAQVTSQMAQLSTVSGIDKLNTTLLSLSNSMTAAQSMSASSMIGHGVLVPASDIQLVNSQALGGVELKQPADSVSVTIQDKAGAVIRTLQLGPQKAGILPYAWDGLSDAGTPVADGTYKFTVTALLSGEKTDPAALSFGMVNAVTPGAKGTMLDVGRLGSFALSDIKQIM